MQPGQVVTAHLTGGVGAEKDKSRPVVVVCDAGRTVLAVAVTDARKKRVPTHARLCGYASGTQVKDALVACEHAWFLDPSRLEPRADARDLTEAELRDVGRCLRIALALAPVRPPPAAPRYRRGAWVTVDLAGALGAEAQGRTGAVVLSNDAGNYFGRTFLVAPVAAADAVLPVMLASDTVDLGRMRVVDVERIVASVADPLPGALAPVDAALEAILP
jgi:mRNA-degrading endonuclease toxin of MazEF toxin-antitoxin module